MIRAIFRFVQRTGLNKQNWTKLERVRPFIIYQIYRSIERGNFASCWWSFRHTNNSGELSESRIDDAKNIEFIDFVLESFFLFFSFSSRASPLSQRVWMSTFSGESSSKIALFFACTLTHIFPAGAWEFTAEMSWIQSTFFRFGSRSHDISRHRHTMNRHHQQTRPASA